MNNVLTGRACELRYSCGKLFLLVPASSSSGRDCILFRAILQLQKLWPTAIYTDCKFVRSIKHRSHPASVPCCANGLRMTKHLSNLQERHSTMHGHAMVSYSR